MRTTRLRRFFRPTYTHIHVYSHAHAHTRTLQAQDIFGNYQETSGDKFYIDVEGFALSPWFEAVEVDGSFTDLGHSGQYTGGYTVTKAGNYMVSVTQAQPGYLEATYFDVPDLQPRSYPVCEEVDRDSDGVLSTAERCKAGGTLPISTLVPQVRGYDTSRPTAAVLGSQ